jgi:hypothetical protein
MVSRYIHGLDARQVTRALTTGHIHEPYQLLARGQVKVVPFRFDCHGINDCLTQGGIIRGVSPQYRAQVHTVFVPQAKKHTALGGNPHPITQMAKIL